MSRKAHVVTLTPAERRTCEQLIRRGSAPAATQRRARILFLADTHAPGRRLTDGAIATAVLVSSRTVARVRARFAADGLQAALMARPRRPTTPRKLDGAAEAHLIALACEPPPAGFATWSLRLLAQRAVDLDIVDAISHETVRTILKKAISNPG